RRDLPVATHRKTMPWGARGIVACPGSGEHRAPAMSLGDRFEAVMAAARNGDEEALTVLYRDVNPRLLRFLSARNPREADDLGSEVWLALARQIPAFAGGEAQWLGLVFLVARRCLADDWRRRARRRTDPVDIELLDRPGHSDVEEEALQSAADCAAASFVTANLTGDQADVILLRVLADLDVAQTAKALSKRPGTVRVIQHRALQRLAAKLGTSGAVAPTMMKTEIA
ncbi:MAG: RNA polymerase sigma factor, partial [Acidimicrobiales bacterium]